MKQTFSQSETPEFSGKAVAALAAGLHDINIIIQVLISHLWNF